jgi:hypothetical protein
MFNCLAFRARVAASVAMCVAVQVCLGGRARAETVDFVPETPGLSLHVAGDTDDGASFRAPAAPDSEGYVRVCQAAGCRAQFAPGKYRFRVFYGDGVTNASPGITQMESYMMIAVSDPQTVAIDRDMRLRAVYTKHEGMRFAAFLTGLTVPLIGVMWGVIGLLIHKPVHAAIGGGLVVAGIGGAYLLNVPDTMRLEVEPDAPGGRP